MGLGKKLVHSVTFPPMGEKCFKLSPKKVFAQTGEKVL
jgi:hypothetical protein